MAAFALALPVIVGMIVAEDSDPDRDDARRTDGGIVILAVPPERRTPSDPEHAVKISPATSGAEPVTHLVPDADVALLAERFAAESADRASTWRQERLHSQIARVASPTAGVSRLSVRCRVSMCQVSGRVTKGEPATDRTAAYALLHQPELASIGVREGLEPGPVAVSAGPGGETEFTAFWVAP
jgi:hypothetical protein